MPSQTLSPAMAARYGVGRTSRGLLAVVAVVVAVFLAIIGVITWRMATPGVQATLLGFDVVSDARVDVTFDVRRDSVSTTVCVLRAQSERHADVGYATVTISPGREYVQTTYPLATSSRATTAEVLGCGVGETPRVDPPQFLPGTTNPSQVPTINGS
jgi:hypothetical protein